MSNYNNLKNAIRSVIRANGNNEITGPILQTELLSMITELGAGYQYVGVATPLTEPGTPDARVMYLAYQPGTYVNFGGVVVTGFCVLKYDTTWTKEDIPISGGSNITVIDTANGDLEFQDPNGNVLVRFANGHIQTKYFNSADSPSGGGSKTNIKVLFFGNSLTQDAVSCLPLFNGYILVPTANCGIFSVFSSTDNAWTNYSNSKNINWVIANCDFDLLVLQEYGNAGQSDATIIDAFNNITEWFANNYSKAIKVASMMDAPARSDVSGVTTRIIHYNEVFYKNCVSQGIIPAGYSMSLACGDSTLNQLGDQGNLSPDGVHAQEGLPCLLQAYVIAMWLFDQYGIGRSIWGSKTRITQAVYTALNVPGPNLGTGVITGTEAENILAQRYAIQAYKNGRIFEDDALTNLT